MQPFVSICIPTYNRAELLKQTIESIIFQPEFLKGQVEIVVSDNASTDNTKEICLSYIKYSNFHYHRNEINIKDQNFPMVLSLAHGKLRKLNNDTLVLFPNSLKMLCDIEKRHEDSKPFVYFTNNDGKGCEFGFHDFVMHMSYDITWIAGFTIWENECVNVKNDTYACDLSLWQVRKAFDLLYKKDRGLIVNNKYAESIAPQKKDLSYGLFQVFYCNYFKLLRQYVEKNVFNSSDISYLKRDLLLRFFPEWVIQKIFRKKKYRFSENDHFIYCIIKECISQFCLLKFIICCLKILVKGILLKVIKFIKRNEQ